MSAASGHYVQNLKISDSPTVEKRTHSIIQKLRGSIAPVCRPQQNTVASAQINVLFDQTRSQEIHGHEKILTTLYSFNIRKRRDRDQRRRREGNHPQRAGLTRASVLHAPRAIANRCFL